MRFFLSRSLFSLLLLGAVSVRQSVAEPTLVLRGHRASQNGEIRLSILRTEISKGCTVSIYAGSDLGSLLSKSKRKQVFTSSSTSEVIGALASSLPRSFVSKILFRAEALCPNKDTISSRIVTASYKGKTGTKPVGSNIFISTLARKFKRNTVSLTPFGSNLKFARMLELQDGGNGRFYIVRQTGIIETIEASNTASTSSVFMDISSQVLSSGERGLLGMAFHPNFSQNREFFLFYIAVGTGTSTLSRFRASDDGLTADSSSEEILLTIEQTTSIHKGGTIRFGLDGYLYISVGDGGPQGDPNGNGQSRKVLLGKILRIDINAASNGKPYSIPSDNPFSGNTSGVREEIYAYGFRNPFKFSFDKTRGTLWAGDVGLSSREEIDIVKKGKNYGWNIKEGTSCFKPKKNCSSRGLIGPVYDYPRTDGASVIGGYVYRGSDLFPLEGLYVFGDFASGSVWALFRDGTTTTRYKILSSGFLPSSFGEDKEGELYLLDYLGGDLFSLELK